MNNTNQPAESPQQEEPAIPTVPQLVRQSRPDSKVQAICRHLRELAFQQEPGSKLPTTRQLCTMLDISRSALHEALNELEAQGVLYRRQGSGIYVSPHLHRKNVCVLFDVDVAVRDLSPFWSLLWIYIVQEAQKRTNSRNDYYSFHIVTMSQYQHHDIELPEDVIAQIQARKIHAVMALRISHSALQWVERQGIPCVSFASYCNWYVVLDGNAMLQLAVQGLVEQGCQRIGFWLYTSEEEGAQVVENFRGALAAHHLPYDPALVYYYKPEPQQEPALSAQEQGYRLVHALFADPNRPKPDGVLVQDDMTAVGVVRALLERNIQPGRDIEVVTPSNSASPALFSYERMLTRVEFGTAAIVQALFSMLDCLLMGGTPEQHRVNIVPVLRPRASLDR